jgi:hypothetical protein
MEMGGTLLTLQGSACFFFFFLMFVVLGIELRPHTS